MYYVFDDQKCLAEGLTKEQILTAIVQAIETHEIADVDTGFVTTIKEQNGNHGLKFWIGTVAEYAAIAEVDPNCVYICTDSTDLQDFAETLDDISARLQTMATMKGEVLLSSQVNYGTGLSVPMTGTAVKNYSAVKVLVDGGGEILCSVYVSEDSDVFAIRGAAPAGITSTSGVVMSCVNIQGSKTDNAITSNKSVTLTVYGSGSTSISGANISSIKGVY